MAGWFSKFIGDGGWVGPAMMAGATLYVGQQAAAANVQAAQIAAQAQARSAAAIQEGNRLAQQRFEQQQADTKAMQAQIQPAVGRLQTMAAADPYAMTPQQDQEVDDTRRQTLNALAVSGLRGSGRATVAAVRRAEDNTRGRLIQQNQQRADAATTNLSGQYFSLQGAGNQMATQAANVDASTGQAVGGTIQNQGNLQAESLLANTSLQGKAIGDIAAVTADSLKEGRRSYYRDNRPAEGDKERL